MRSNPRTIQFFQVRGNGKGTRPAPDSPYHSILSGTGGEWYRGSIVFRLINILLVAAGFSLRCAPARTLKGCAYPLTLQTSNPQTITALTLYLVLQTSYFVLCPDPEPSNYFMYRNSKGPSPAPDSPNHSILSGTEEPESSIFIFSYRLNTKVLIYRDIYKDNVIDKI